MNYTKSTITKRLKVINKGLREAKKEWKKAETRRTWISRHAPQYGNEFDYSTTMSQEDKEKYDEAEGKAHTAINKEIHLKDEKKYLEGLSKGKMKPFDKYAWSYMK